MIHVVSWLANAFGGTEQAAFELYRGLAQRGEASLWSEGTPDPRLGEVARRIADGDFPRGGTLVVVGNFFAPGGWLERAEPERLVLIYNTTVSPSVRMRAIDRLRKVREPELVYISTMQRDWVGIPGMIFPSRIDLTRFRPGRGARQGFVVGRHSRDVPDKHHPQDATLYRRLLEDPELRLRVLGGTCMARHVTGPNVELLAEGAQPAPVFLQSLDCFLYRTAPSLTEAGGRVVAEAMACGLPVVCDRRGGHTEWIEHGRNGLLFSGNDEALEHVRALRADPARCAALGAAARASMEAMFSGPAQEAYFDFFHAPRKVAPPALQRGRRVDFAWELGGGMGHVTTLMPLARRMQEQGHQVRFLAKDLSSTADVQGAAEIPREAAPHWVGPPTYQSPRNFGEILHNFGYQDPRSLRQLVDAWRERLWRTQLLVANVAPAAHLAADTLGIPSLEISQGFHNPPPGVPAPPLRDWEAAPRAELEAADRRVLAAMNEVRTAYGISPIDSIGALLAGRSVLLTYPELDIYSERGASDYYGVPDTAEGSATPPWPVGKGARALAYFHGHFGLTVALAEALAQADSPTLIFWRGVTDAIRQRFAGSPVLFSDQPLAMSRLLPHCDLVACHASHQMTAQALLAGKPLLMLPTQLEQFLIMRRVVRQGAGLGIASDVAKPDFRAALAELAGNPRYAQRARDFAARYAGHSRQAALDNMLARCAAALGAAA